MMTMILAYSAVLLSFASGLLALMSNQRGMLLTLSQRFLTPDAHFPRCRNLLDRILEESRYASLHRQAVFVLLGLSGVFAVLAGLAVMMGQDSLTDKIGLGLPWLPWHVRFDGLSGFFFIINLLNGVAKQLLGQSLPNDTSLSWLWLAPVSVNKVSYSPPMVLVGVLIAGGISFWYLRRNLETKTMRRAAAWDCGFGGLNPRVQ